MTPLHRLARRASRRITMARFLRVLGVALPVSVTLGALVILGDRLIGPGFPWWWGAMGAVLLALGTSAALAWRARSDEIGAASHVDAALKLKDRLGSAIALERTTKDDPFATIAVSEATELAKRVSVHHAIPVGPDRSWWWWPVASAALVGVGIFVPQLRLLENHGARQAAIERVAEQQKAVTALEDATKKAQEALNVGSPDEQGDFELSKQISNLADIDKQMKAGVKDPQEAVGEAASAMDQAADELNQKAADQQAEDNAAQDMAQAASQELEPKPGSEAVDKMIEAMRKGDTEAALKAAEELEKAMEQMTPEQREQAAQRLEQMADAMNNAAQQAQKNAASQSQQTSQGLANRGLSQQQASQMQQNANAGASQQSLEKQLRDQGMNAEDARELAKSLCKSGQAQRASQNACKNAGQCSSAMKAGAQSLRQCTGNSSGKNGQQGQGNQGDKAGQLTDPNSKNAGQGSNPANGVPAGGTKGGMAPPNGPPGQGAGKGSGLHNLKQHLTGAVERTKLAQQRAQQAQALRTTKDELLRQLGDKSLKDRNKWIEQQLAEGMHDKNWQYGQDDVDARQSGDDGQVIARQYMPGDTPAPYDPDAVSHRELPADLSGAMTESAEHAIENRAVPPRYQKTIQRYFQKTIQRAKAGEPVKPAPASGDATDAAAKKKDGSGS